MADKTQLFNPGLVVCTPGALREINDARIDARDLIARHLRGDFGDLCTDDREQNLLAIELGDRVLSSYVLPTQVKVWVITEADRSATTLLLPDEY